MSDIFSDFTSGLESPATRLMAVTPDDVTDMVYVSRAINVATSGTVRVTTIGGDTETVYIAAGVAFPVRASRIWATGTTAGNVVVMF